MLKSGYTPWLENDSTVLAKFVAYLPLRLLAKLVPRKVLIRSLKALIGMDRSTVGFENVIVQGACRYREWTTPREWLADTVCLTSKTSIYQHRSLARLHGLKVCDYMVLPPSNNESLTSPCSSIWATESMILKRDQNEEGNYIRHLRHAPRGPY